MPYRVVAVHRPPFVFYNANRVGNARFTGLIIDLLPLLFQAANVGNGSVASFDFYNIPSDSGGALLPNGSWNGIMGELTNRQADLAAYPLTLVPGRPEAIDVTYSYISGGDMLLVQKGKPEIDPLLFLQPFEPALWGTLVAIVFGIAAVMFLLARITPYGDFTVKRMRRAGGGTGEEGRFVIENENDSFLLEAWLAIFGERRGLPQGRSWALRIVGLAFAFFSVVVVAAYTANFASLLTVTQLDKSIQSLADLNARNGTMAITPSGATEGYFNSVLDPIAAEAGHRRISAATTLDGVAAVRDGAAQAFVTDMATLKYYAQRYPCDLEVVGDSFGPGTLVYGLPKASPLTTPLNRGMLELYNNGLLDQLVRRYMTDLDECRGGSELSNNKLSVKQFTGLFYMLLIFAGVAFLWALAERGASAYARRNPKAAAHYRRAMGAIFRHEHKRYDLEHSFDGRGEHDMPKVQPNGAERAERAGSSVQMLALDAPSA